MNRLTTRLGRSPGTSLAAVAAVALLAVAAGCGAPAPGGSPPAGAAAEPIPVAASVPPLAWLADRVGGERVETAVMLPPGRSPHTFEPAPKEIVALERARLYVAVGHPDFLFERKLLAAIAERGAPLRRIDMAALVPPRPSPENAGETDPHVWTSPAAMRAAARAVAEALAELDPAGAEGYRARQARLDREIDAADRDIRTSLAGLAGRELLVYHPAWGYFADHYGLVQRAIESGGKEPSPRRLVELIEQARAGGVGVVFVQTGFSDRGARVVAEEIGARVVTLDPMAYDWLANLRRAAAAFRQALAAGPPPGGSR